MDPGQIITELESVGVKLEVVGDRLRLQPSEKVPKELLDAVRQAKPEIVAYLVDRDVWNTVEAERLLREQGWVVVRCRNLDGAQVLWVLDRNTQIPLEVAGLPRYFVDELEYINKHNCWHIYLVKSVFQRSEVEK